MSTPRHIVVIDDCAVTLAIATDILENAGFRVSTAEDTIYSNHLIYTAPPPDLILLDVMMPWMTGDRKLRVLRERHKSSAIPVILMSSMEETKLSVVAAEAGADAYLTKPFSAEQLLGIVHRHLQP